MGINLKLKCAISANAPYTSYKILLFYLGLASTELTCVAKTLQLQCLISLSCNTLAQCDCIHAILLSAVVTQASPEWKDQERDTDRNKEKEKLEACANSAFMNTNCYVNKNTVRDCQDTTYFPFSWFLQSRLSPHLFHFPTAIWYFVQAFEVGSRGRGSSQSLSMPLCDQ